MYVLSFSGGVMIYFDRIEVVNYLIPSAGKLVSVQQTQSISQCIYPQLLVHFFSHLEITAPADPFDIVVLQLAPAESNICVLCWLSLVI